MIDSNLNSLIQFLNRDQLIVIKESMKTRSAVLQAVMSSAEKRLYSGEIEEVKVCMKAKIIRQLSPKQKIKVYELVRLLACGEIKDNWFALLLADITEFYTKTGIKQNLRYLYLSELNDKQFCYDFDVILWSKRQRTNFFRFLNNPVYNSKGQKLYSNLFEVVIALIDSFHVEFIYKNRPKKLVYRKGYNDHGSMGSEYSKTLKQQSRDWSLNEREQANKKWINDFIELLLGFRD